jgi:hypothetical protein
MSVSMHLVRILVHTAMSKLMAVLLDVGSYRVIVLVLQ